MDDIETIRLGRKEAPPPVALSSFDKLGERLVRHIRTVVEPLAGIKPRLTITPAEMVNFDTWLGKAPDFAALHVYRLSPLKGNMLLRIEPAMVTSLVDRYFGGVGGDGGKATAGRREFTPSEERFLLRLSGALVGALVETWSDTVQLDQALVARETDPHSLTFAEPTDQMLVQQIEISVSRDENWQIEFMFPLVALRQLEPMLSAPGSEDGQRGDMLWRTQLADQMRDIRLPARTVLARTRLNLTDLLALKPGDVIPVNIARSLPLIVGDRVIAHGTIGEQNGHAAFRVENLS